MAPTPGEVEDLGPYLELAKRIHAEVARVAADDRADAASLVEAIEAVPREERARVVRAVFDLLPPERQWEVIERAFGDAELRSYLADEHAARLDHVRRVERWRVAATDARAERRLDLRLVPAGDEITFGLFRPDQARTALTRGREASNCARELVSRLTDEPALLRVIDDVFNPEGGLFVTADYDESVWRTERLGSHELVRVGSVLPDGSFEPVVYPAARVDVEVDGRVTTGRLHLGYALIGTEDVFAS
ncbi:MAG TPA: hypothetical protein VJM33_06160 [Microthrixaceae bacterium]|nr:hypothetical protein [Microthrixaceae bacterium]